MSEKDTPLGKKVRIERIYPEDLKSNYIADIVVQHEAELFILSFFEVWPPVLLAESEDEKRKAFDALDHVDAKCAARFVITPSKMKEFIKALQDNYEKYEKLRASIGDKR